MNIILFTILIDYGGVSTYFLRMNDVFIKNRVKSKLVYFKDERKELNNCNYNLIEKIKIIKTECLENNADFIITNYGIETIMAKVATVFLKKKTKIISIVHMRSVMWMPNYKNMIKKYIFKLMIKISFLICDKCIAVSEGLREEIIKEKWIKDSKIVTLYNPVIEDSFNHKVRSIKGKKEIHLGIIGWIWDIKNQEEVINALYKLNDKKYKLHIIGGIKDKDYYLKLKHMVKNLGLEEQVFFEGIKADIFKELNNIDILLLSSKTEALPTVIIEAMSCGVPVIATNCKFGPSEIIEHGKFGFIYEENNIDELIKYIRILDNKEEYKRISLNSLKRANDFSCKKSIAQYINLMKGLKVN